MDRTIFFEFEGKEFSINTFPVTQLVVLPDSRVVRITGWTSEIRPQPTGVVLYNHHLDRNTKPGKLAKILHAVVAEEKFVGLRLFRFVDSTLTLMGWRARIEGENLYLGPNDPHPTRGYRRVGGLESRYQEICEQIERMGYKPNKKLIKITDETALRLFLEKRLTVRMLERASEIDGNLALEINFCDQSFEVIIVPGKPGVPRFDFEKK